MANFKNTGNYYVDPSNPSASNNNAGTDPDLPKSSIQGALDVVGLDQTIILADGLYSVVSLSAPNRCIIEGDGLVILEGNGVDSLTGVTLALRNCICIDYVFVVRGKNAAAHEDNIYINCGNVGDVGGAGQNVYNRCKFINSGAKTDINQIFNYCIFTGTSEVNLRRSSQIDNCICTGNSTLISENETNVINSSFNNIERPIYVGVATYNNLAECQSAIAGAFPSSINVPTKLNRLSTEQLTFDFSVEGTSLVLGAGQNGTNIGDVRRGISITRNSDAVQNGTISNIVFDGSTWLVQGSNTTGTITSDVIDFGLTIKSPQINIKGLVNFLDNVPDFNNALRNPNKLDLECRYAEIGQDITVKAWKPFLFGERMLIDGSGRSNGEENFDWNDTVIINMKTVQFRVTLRQNYNV